MIKTVLINIGRFCVSSDTNIGARIKKRRKQLELSLRELAKRADLTASFLSQVERGKANASIDSLRRIAEALEVSMLYFLAENPKMRAAATPSDISTVEDTPEVRKYDPVVRADARPKLILSHSGVTYELLTPDLANKMEVICGRLSPGANNVARPLREPTEEWIYVLSGALLIELNDDTHILNPGDAIYFEGRALQRLTCASDKEVVWISVITPPVF